MKDNQLDFLRLDRAGQSRRMLEELPGNYEPIQFLRKDEVEQLKVVGTSSPSHRQPFPVVTFRDDEQPQFGLWTISVN